MIFIYILFWKIRRSNPKIEINYIKNVIAHKNKHNSYAICLKKKFNKITLFYSIQKIKHSHKSFVSNNR